MDKYKIMISEVGNAIKPLFKKKSDLFICYKSNNIGLISFQKSIDSSSKRLLFTINLGVYSNSLHVLDSPGIGTIPSTSDCHWKKRIGLLLPILKDYWWTIDETTSISDLTIEIINIITSVAIPEIERHISDESLKKHWLKGESSGISEQQMYLYLIALLQIENSHILNIKIDELKALSKGKTFERNVMECLSKLGINNG